MSAMTSEGPGTPTAEKPKKKKKQMTLDSMLPQHAERARKLEVAAKAEDEAEAEAEAAKLDRFSTAQTGAEVAGEAEEEEGWDVVEASEAPVEAVAGVVAVAEAAALRKELAMAVRDQTHLAKALQQVRT